MCNTSSAADSSDASGTQASLMMAYIPFVFEVFARDIPLDT